VFAGSFVADLEASLLPRRPSTPCSFRWMADKRRTRSNLEGTASTVVLLPRPSSLGARHHGLPARRTYAIHVGQARSETRSRPPMGLGTSGGSIGWISVHQRRETGGSAPVSPPCHPWHSLSPARPWVSTRLPTSRRPNVIGAGRPSCLTGRQALIMQRNQDVSSISAIRNLHTITLRVPNPVSV
jgi:hypothetical protein